MKNNNRDTGAIIPEDIQLALRLIQQFILFYNTIYEQKTKSLVFAFNAGVAIIGTMSSIMGCSVDELLSPRREKACISLKKKKTDETLTAKKSF